MALRPTRVGADEDGCEEDDGPSTGREDAWCFFDGDEDWRFPAFCPRFVTSGGSKEAQQHQDEEERRKVSLSHAIPHKNLESQLQERKQG